MRGFWSVLLLVLVVASGRVLAGEPLKIGDRRELFIDDYLIGSLSGDVHQLLQKPTPQEVVLTTDKPWEGNTSAYFTVFQDGDLTRMYYRGAHYNTETKKPTHPEVACYAESRDGIHFTKPNLGLIEYDGSKENNIVWDGIGTHCFTVFKDANPNCPPEARYKAISRGRPQGKAGLYTFQSPDGVRWTQTSDGPVITQGAFDSQNLAFYDTHAKTYRAYHRSFTNGVRAIMTETSDDFIHWTKPQLLVYQQGTPNQHLYTNAVQQYLRAPHLLIGFPTRFLPNEGQRVEPILMSSRDGVHFHRWNEEVISEDAPKDRKGNRSNYMTWGIIQRPGETRTLDVYATEAYYEGPDSRVRRFSYRTDGFVAIHAHEQGELLTKPLTFAGSKLDINYVAREGGRVRVELQDAEGKPMPGFALADATPLTGDDIDATVAWKSGKDVGKLAGKAIRVRFVLENADLYSLKFGK